MTRRRSRVQFVVAAVLLTAAFDGNAFQTVDAAWFQRHSAAMEGWVAARMVVARRDGFLSHGGLLGECAEPRPSSRSQLEIYFRGLEVADFEPYQSQVGLQGLAAAAFDRIAGLSPFQTWRWLRFVTSLLTASAIALLLVGIGSEFGSIAFAAALGATILSPWVTVFGANLFWSSWAFYVPCVVAWWVLGTGRSTSGGAAALAVGAAVLVKCLFNGYEFMTTTLVMMAVPVVYAGTVRRWSIGKLASRGGWLVVASGVGVLVSMVVLCVQIAATRGSVADGIDHIVYSFQKRSYADAAAFPVANRASLEAGVGEVVAKYLAGTALGHRRPFDGIHPETLDRSGRITYADLLVVFATVTAGAFWLLRRWRGRPLEAAKLRGLVVCVWFSLLAPLSWFVVFKAHSYLHTHINFITWHMPFVPLGAALCGYVVSLGIREIRSRPDPA